VHEVPREDVGTETKPALLPLDAPRAVAFKTKTGNFVYHFRRIELKDWEKYFQSIVHQTINTRGAREEVFESDSALVDLVDRTVSSVDGYALHPEPKDWKRTLPIQHRLVAGTVLRAVGQSTGARDLGTLCDLVDVSLDANWGVSDGKTTQYTGLIHRFRQPGIADLKRFNFEAARVRVTGNAENGITSYPARQGIAMKIYDDLIESVDGYSVKGLPLSETFDEVKEWMDGAHKAAAVLALFSQDEQITVE
jgi:hypothetical protein